MFRPGFFIIVAMKLWLSKNSEISIREQLVEQITLGIASRDLKPGEKLPSTRELARRFNVHQNTVSRAYRALVEVGLLKFRRGSGVYVSELPGSSSPENGLDGLVNNLLENAARLGYTNEQVRSRLLERLNGKRLNTFLLIESDPELSAILAEELRSFSGGRVDSVAFEAFDPANVDEHVQLVAMFDEREKLQPLLGPERSCNFLKANSVPDSMAGRSRPNETELVAIVSGWGRFLALAKLFLLAAQLDPESIITRDTGDPGWRSGLHNVSLLICDSLAARQFNGDPRLRVFPLIADSSLDELRQYIIRPTAEQ